MMLGTIASILGVLAFIFGFIIFFIRNKTDTNLERRFSQIYKELEKLKDYYFPSQKKPPLIIVESGDGKEKIRTFFKKIWFKIRGCENPHVVYIFHKNSPEEKESHIIYLAVASEYKTIEVLDIEFIETLINYLAYKFAITKKNINKKVEYLLRKEYESSAHRGCIIKLDDPDFQGDAVINPPPLKKSFLKNLIIPIAIDQNNRVNNLSFSQKENIKTCFMKIINMYCQKKCGVLFVGKVKKTIYLESLRQVFNKYEFFLLCARGKNIRRLNGVYTGIEELMPSMLCCEIIYEGQYQFIKKHKELVNYKILFLEKSNQA